MSQHKRLHKASHEPKKTPLLNNRLVWIGAGLALLLIVGLLLVQRGSQSDFVPQVTGAPAVEVAATHVDHGDVHYEQMVESKYTLTNVGDKQLIIRGTPHIEVVEGCCPPRVEVSDTTIEPGETATVSMRYSMHEGMGGAHLFRVHVETNDPTTPTVELTAASNWIP